MVAVYHAALLRAVHRLGILLLGVLWGAIAHMGEHRALLQQRIFIFRHQVVLHLDAGRNAPAMLGNESKHIPEALPHELRVLVAAVARTDHTLAHAVIGVISLYSQFGVLQLSGQIHVVHGNLAQRELTCVAVHVRHTLVHEARVAQLALIPYQAVGRLVEDIADGGVGERDRLAVLVGEVVGVEEFARLHVVGIQLATDETVVEVTHLRAVWFVGQAPKPQYQPLQLHIHLSGVLVAKLSADQGGISTLAVLVHLLLESEHRGGQRVVVLFLQHLHHLRHHLPVVGLAHQLAIGGGSIVEGDAGVEHRCVHHVLLHLFGGEVEPGLAAIVEEGHRPLVYLVVAGHPALQPHLGTVRKLRLHLLPILGGQAIHGNQGIASLPLA